MTPKRGGRARPSSHSAPDRLIIEDIGPKGDGIAHGRNGTVFIDRGLPGDEVEARVSRSEDGVLRGSIERLIEPSRFRRTPPCPLYDRCGGCSLQHADDDFYEGFKDNIVRAPLAKVGLKPKYLPTVFCAPRSRRRATFAVLPQRNGQLLMGYYKRRSHMITAIPDCLVVHDDVLAWRDKISPYLKPMITGSKAVDVFIQVVDGAAEIVITGPVGAKGVPDLTVREAAGTLVRDTGAARVSWRKTGYDVPEILVQEKPLLARFGPLSVPLPPNAFMQPTLEGQKALTDAVLGFLPDKPKAIADLFAGCGTFSGPLLDSGARVDAYDISGVEQLAKAVAGHPLKTFKRDLFKKPLSATELNAYDVVVFDPPRAGCKEQAQDLARSRVPCLIGVSCNPTTFARDARILCDGGYRLEAVKIVDQFVWSHHVELVAKFTR